MPWSSKHLKWLVDTGKVLKTSEGKNIAVWEFQHKKDNEIISAWAKHFRNHYCLDSEIDYFRKGYNYSRADYLNNIKFPDSLSKLGPGIRAGDFGEILVADYLQYILGFWVPRSRYSDKNIRNESIKGCDIIGFKYLYNGKDEKDDVLAIFEAKTQFSGNKAKSRLQDAVDGSALDYLRKAESLNAIKQRLESFADAGKVERFQNPVDRPYQEIYGAVALFSTKVFDEKEILKTETKNHSLKDRLFLLVISGNDMMQLVSELYRRAADEA